VQACIAYGAFYSVYNTLGYGFLEKVVYVNALLLELKKLGLTVANEVAIGVLYAGEVIGEYFAELVVNDVVIVEVRLLRPWLKSMRPNC